MQNLAGNKDCDGIIQRELLRARIEAVRGERVKREVPYSVTGRLVVKSTGAEVRLTRAWYYWVASGPVPLDLATRLYADPVGAQDVRVAGHCGCPPPEEWATWLDEKGREVVSREKLDAERVKYGLPGPTMSKIYADIDADPSLNIVRGPVSDHGKPFVTTYHIDTEVGLRLFADVLAGGEPRP